MKEHLEELLAQSMLHLQREGVGVLAVAEQVGEGLRRMVHVALEVHERHPTLAAGRGEVLAQPAGSGLRRTLLDDFNVPAGEIWTLGGMCWTSVHGAGELLGIPDAADELGRALGGWPEGVVRVTAEQLAAAATGSGSAATGSGSGMGSGSGSGMGMAASGFGSGAFVDA